MPFRVRAVGVASWRPRCRRTPGRGRELKSRLCSLSDRNPGFAWRLRCSDRDLTPSTTADRGSRACSHARAACAYHSPSTYHVKHAPPSQVGHVGSCDIELGTTTKAFVSFECRTPRAYRYNVRLLQHALRALQVASRTCIRMNEVGMLGFQHKLSHADGTVRWLVRPRRVSSSRRTSALPPSSRGVSLSCAHC